MLFDLESAEEIRPAGVSGRRPALLDRPREEPTTWADVRQGVEGMLLASGLAHPEPQPDEDGLVANPYHGLLGPRAANLFGAERISPEAARSANLALAIGTGVSDGGVGNMAGTFAGRNARGVAPLRIAEAENLIRQGVSPQDVQARTLVHQGLDGNLRYEIDDSQAAIRPDVWQRSLAAGSAAAARGKEHPGLLTTMGEAVDHPRLFAEYPDMMTNPLRLYAGVEHLPGSGGRTTGMVEAAEPGLFGTRLFAKPDRFHIAGLTPDDIMPTVVHEGGHGVQEREGWSPGTTNDARNPLVAEQARRFAVQHQRGLQQAVQAETDLYAKFLTAHPGSDMQAFAQAHPAEAAALLHGNQEMQYWRDPARRQQYLDYAYRAAAGEQEATAIETRRLFDDAQRRAVHPYDSHHLPGLAWDARTGRRLP